MVKRKPGDAKRAVAYLRVSTEEQSNGVEAQRAAIEAWAKRNDVEVVSWHEDRLSGAIPVEDRPALLGALQALREAGAGLLLVGKRDRLARDVVVAATIEKLVKGAGGVVTSADGVSVEDTPEGALMRTLLDAFAAYERAMIRSRTRAALQAKKARGERYSRKPPWGFAYEDGRLVPCESERELLSSIQGMREASLSYAAIARRLNDSGTPCRSGRWHPTSVRRVLVPGSR